MACSFSRMVSTISHDLKTPISAIQSGTSLLSLINKRSARRDLAETQAETSLVLQVLSVAVVVSGSVSVVVVSVLLLLSLLSGPLLVSAVVVVSVLLLLLLLHGFWHHTDNEWCSTGDEKCDSDGRIILGQLVFERCVARLRRPRVRTQLQRRSSSMPNSRASADSDSMYTADSISFYLVTAYDHSCRCSLIGRVEYHIRRSSSSE